MGIDKSNVRFVYHIDMPESIEDYYQEIGRTGRDGKPAVALAFYSIEERNFHLRNISSIQDTDERYFEMDNLNEIAKLFLHSTVCCHKLILEYCGEDADPFEERCDICCGTKRLDTCNYLNEANMIMQCFTSLQSISMKITFHLLLLTVLGSGSQDKLKGLIRLAISVLPKNLTFQIRRRRNCMFKSLY